MKKRCFLIAGICVLTIVVTLLFNVAYPKRAVECSNPINAEVTLISEFGLIRSPDYSQRAVGVVSFKIGDVLYAVGHECYAQDMSLVYKIHPKFNVGTEDYVGRVSLGNFAQNDILLGKVVYSGEDGVIISTNDLNTTEYQTIEVANKVVSGEAELLVRDETRKLNSYDITVKVVAERGRERLEVCVTDQELLDKTGGILRGMSGSPIIQDGKLIGVLSHAYLKDHTQGKGQIIWEIDCIKEYYTEN